jgi:hypothetical protein
MTILLGAMLGAGSLVLLRQKDGAPTSSYFGQPRCRPSFGPPWPAVLHFQGLKV